MRKTLVTAFLLLGGLAAQAQEKVMNIQRTDGTIAQTRVADLKQISFLALDAGDQGLLVKTLGGETAAVLFETNPVVTVGNGTLTITPASTEAMTFEIADIAEIVFGDTPSSITHSKQQGVFCVWQASGVLLRGIPQGVKPCVYSTDGRSVPAPALHNGELRLSRETLGTGIFIVKVGTFSTKIRL